VSYRQTHELPEGIKSSLPEDLQKIYLRSFNQALAELKSEKMDINQAKIKAHQRAWTAIKKRHEFQNGVWVDK
jgi:cation transport regulator ChaB